MWKFNDLPYERPDVAAFQTSFKAAIDRFTQAKTYAEAREAYLAQDQVQRDFSSASTLVSIRNTMDTRDPFYDAENAFFNQVIAEFVPLTKAMLDALLATPFRAEFEKEFGKQLFVVAELEASTQSDAIVPDLIEESELGEEYKKITAGCEVEFRGEKCNFYGLLKYMENPDRAIRRAAYIEWAKLYEGISDSLDAIYDKLIAVRLRMAEKLGFSSYTDLAYAKMTRSDYNAEDVRAFRQQIRDVIVPAVARYRAQQAERIGVDKLRYYDESFMFPDGNADPVGGEDVLVPIATRMYRELSPETGEFFDYMVDHGLFDLQTRQGKHLGGYCTYLFAQHAPFIFSNFNGTAADTGVLTHEAGHAFAFYSSAKTQPIIPSIYGTTEVCEIHSMTMEHFTYPWLKDMFGEENAERAQFSHLVDALSAIPYLATVDEYQHRVFEKPGMTAKERRQVWHELEQIYLPWRDYDGVEFLAEGGFWMQKQHIFLYPFYYIDYAIAQTCAFEFYGRMKKAPKEAWADYLTLCKAGGSRSFKELLALSHLSNPFEPGSVQRAVGHVIEELDGK